MRSSHDRRLTTTLLLVIVAFVLVAGVAFVVGTRAKAVAFPRWGGGLDVVRSAEPLAAHGRDVRLGEVDADGVRLVLGIDASGTYVADSSCTSGATTPPVGSVCSVHVSAADLGTADVRVTSLGDGEYILTPRGDAPVRVRVASTGKYERFFRGSNLASPRAIPGLIIALAALALLFALSRVRLAVAYVRRMSSWKELVLSREGMLQDEAGATVGTVSSDVKLPPGPVLVDADAMKGTSIYRELSIVTRRAVASGSHALWERGTALRLRDARVLSIVATVASLLAGAAQVLAG